jgi:hypothetical protein
MWTIPDYFISNFNELSIDYLKFVFEQSEKKLIELVKAGEDLTKKAHSILAIAITVFTLSLGSFFTLHLEDSFIKVALITISALSFISVALLIKPLISYSTYVTGSDPSSLLLEKNLTNFSNDLFRIKNMYLNETVEYQKRIDYNRKINIERANFVDRAMFTLMLSPFFAWLLGCVFLYIF